jgi:hypothetical protein
MPADQIAITTFQFNANREVLSPRGCEERRLGRDIPTDNLVLPDDTIRRVNEIEAAATLNEFSNLPLNWDGYGALPVADETSANAKSALQTALAGAPAADIAPNPNGTITFGWTTDRGMAQLEIGKTKYSFFCKPKGASSIHADGLASDLPLELGQVIAAILHPSMRPLAALTSLNITASNDRKRA